MRKRIRIALCMILVLFLAGSITANAASFSLSHNKVTVNVGDKVDLDIVTENDEDYEPIWTSWNVNVIKVNQDGEVTALRKGTATVSARVGLTIKKCKITVVNPSIKVNKTEATIYTGGTSKQDVKLKATVTGASKDVVWNSSNPDIATVDNTGKVTSVSAGNATITATANGLVASCDVTVKESSITLDIQQMQLSTSGNGSSIKLKPTIVGTSKGVKWESSDPKIASVSGGTVKGKKSGEVTIKATANDVFATCKVTVIKDSVSIKTEKELLYVGETKKLKTNAGKKDVVVWESTADEVVSVDENGELTAKGAGTAVISASLNGTTDTCEVTIKDSVMSIEEDRIALKTKGTDKTYTLNYEVVGRNTSVAWKSSDATIASVKNGKITAKKEGQVTITATANDISDSVDVTVSVYDPTIKLNQTEYTLYTNKGDTVTLKATVDGPVKKAEWTSSASGVATVDKNGKVKAISEGTATITATANGVSAECEITVIESKVILEKESIYLNKGQKAELPVDVVGTSQTVTYTSKNAKIATVKNGMITAKKNGETDITVTANGIKAICHVTVGDCQHDYTSVRESESTCITHGIVRYTCSLCGSSYTEKLPYSDCAWGVVEVVPPTCTEAGYTTYECSVCKDQKVADEVDALDHDWSAWRYMKPVTEEEDGLQQRTCQREGCEAFEEQIVSKDEHKHVYTSEVTPPTCEEDGYTTNTCECGYSYIDGIVNKLGHDWSDWKFIKPVTEEEDGAQKRTCQREGCDEFEERVVPKDEHEHVYTSELTPPTCTEEGYITYTCECGGSYVESVEELGHDWSDWKFIKPVTEEEDGVQKRTCQREGCEAFEEQTVPKAEHEHVPGEWIITLRPTFLERGEQKQFCTSCEAELAVKSVAVAKIPDGDQKLSITLESGVGYVIGHYDRELASAFEDLIDSYREENGLEVRANDDNTANQTASERRAREIAYLFSDKTPAGYDPTSTGSVAAELKAEYFEEVSAEEVFNAFMADENSKAVLLKEYEEKNAPWAAVFCENIGDLDDDGEYEYQYYWVYLTP